MRFTTTVSRAINRYVGIKAAVNCYSQRKKILYISLRHSVREGKAAQMVQTFIDGQMKGD